MKADNSWKEADVLFFVTQTFSSCFTTKAFQKNKQMLSDYCEANNVKSRMMLSKLTLNTEQKPNICLILFMNSF